MHASPEQTLVPPHPVGAAYAGFSKASLLARDPPASTASGSNAAGSRSSPARLPASAMPTSDTWPHATNVRTLSTRYVLVCHETRSKVAVGGEGDRAGEMLSALVTDASREALCEFLMHSHGYSLFLVAEHWTGASSFPLYREFLGEHTPISDLESMSKLRTVIPDEPAGASDVAK
jgi:hypothetical protein